MTGAVLDRTGGWRGTMTYDPAGETPLEGRDEGTNPGDNSTSKVGLPVLLALPRIGLMCALCWDWIGDAP